jgi:hypothetical protein
MSASNPPPPVPDENAWPEMSAEEEAELQLAFAQAEEDQRNGVLGIPIDEVLPRYRRAG